MPVHVYGNGDVALWATAKDSKKFVIHISTCKK